MDSNVLRVMESFQFVGRKFFQCLFLFQCFFSQKCKILLHWQSVIDHPELLYMINHIVSCILTLPFWKPGLIRVLIELGKKTQWNYFKLNSSCDNVKISLLWSFTPWLFRLAVTTSLKMRAYLTKVNELSQFFTKFFR